MANALLAESQDTPPSRTQWKAIGRAALLVLTVLSITFPYVQLIPLGSYTQPYAMILGLLVIGLSRASSIRRIPWPDMSVLVSFAGIGIILFVVTCAPFRDVQEYKYLLNYVSPLILTMACFILLEWDRRRVAQVVSASILIWFWVGMAQALVNASFMTLFLGEWGSLAGDIAASGRGVIGLAPEPTHHAFHMILLGGCAVLLRQPRWTIVLSAISVLLLARSPNGALVLALAVAIALTVYRPRAVVLCIALLLAAILLSVGNALLAMGDGNRILTLLGRLLTNPTMLITEDYSTNMRIGGAMAGLLDVVESSFFPYGLSAQTWVDARSRLMEHFPFLIDISGTGLPSGYGVLLFQAGVLAFPFIWMSTTRIVQTQADPYSRVYIFAVPLVFVFQYYVSAPQFGLAYACAIYLAQRDPKA